MLYDDPEQLEVRHVISLAHYYVDIYAGGEPIPEGELWIKRNCIRLTQRAQLDSTGNPKPFYLFSDNCSEKEDFYHAMLRTQERHGDASPNPPFPLKFNTHDLVRLVQQLHASEENLHTRWVNALIGRLFLALYKTSEIERFVWTKITKKIARVPKPALISSINVQKIDMGSLPPFITNPKLKELTVDGDLTIEADISYKGNFRLEISAIARIELGSRFKAREVNLVLATILKRLEGHILLRIKPPPSNRAWVTFETAPKMELSLEPIVSSRQITYGIILRAIESRIREVVSETLVLPNWDDIPFSDSSLQHFRGGIWKNGFEEGDFNFGLDGMEKKDHPEALRQENVDPGGLTALYHEESKSMASLGVVDSLGLRGATQSGLDPLEGLGVSTATDLGANTKPRAIRSSSFASAASPIVNINPANASANRIEGRSILHDAATAMKTTISRSPPTSPTDSSAEFPSRQSAIPVRKVSSTYSQATVVGRSQRLEDTSDTGSLGTQSSPSSHDRFPDSDGDGSRSMHGSSTSLPLDSLNLSSNRSPTFNHSLNSATAAAKKWLTTRQTLKSPSHNTERHSTHRPRSDTHPEPSPIDMKGESKTELPSGYPVSSSSPASVNHRLGPIGRGHPLPPPGTPLPPPSKAEKRSTWNIPTASAFATLTRRKPVPVKRTLPASRQDLPSHRQSSTTPPDIADFVGNETTPTVQHSLRRRSSSTSSMASISRSGAPPPLPKRRQRLSITDNLDKYGDSEMLVVKAPSQEASAPTSPIIPTCHDAASYENNNVGPDSEEENSIRDTELQDEVME